MKTVIVSVLAILTVLAAHDYLLINKLRYHMANELNQCLLESFKDFEKERPGSSKQEIKAGIERYYWAMVADCHTDVSFKLLYPKTIGFVTYEADK